MTTATSETFSIYFFYRFLIKLGAKSLVLGWNLPVVKVFKKSNMKYLLYNIFLLRQREGISERMEKSLFRSFRIFPLLDFITMKGRPSSLRAILFQFVAVLTFVFHNVIFIPHHLYLGLNWVCEYKNYQRIRDFIILCIFTCLILYDVHIFSRLESNRPIESRL